MDLLLDIGNSRLKWCWSDGGRLINHGAAVRDASLFTTLAICWGGAASPGKIAASSVAGSEFGEQLRGWCRERWAVDVDYVVVEQGWRGLDIAYPQPQHFGVDRWLAIIAARQRYMGAICVIDAGTAMTIDVVAATGKHLGGVIVPGLGLMRQALLQRSAGISRGMASQQAMCDELLGQDTRSGVERGTLYAVAGAIVHTLARVKAAGGGSITTIITGGDAEVVVAEIGADYKHHPDLVLHGLQLLSDC